MSSIPREGSEVARSEREGFTGDMERDLAAFAVEVLMRSRTMRSPAEASAAPERDL